MIILINLCQNFIAAWKYRLGMVESDIGATHLRKSTLQSVEYIDRVYHDYLNYGGIKSSDLKGKKILEIGPGDNLGVALRLYAAGAEQVVCFDKFFAKRIPERQVAIYRMLRERLNDAERQRYDQAVDLEQEARINETAIRYLYGVAAEKADTLLEPESFDLIVSRAVIWEIYDVDDVLVVLDKLLRPGGRMIHKIACLDWAFRQEGYNPLEFLTIPEPLYKLMARNSGKSNRRTIHFYRHAMRALYYDTVFHITRVVGGEGDDFAPGTTTLIKGTHYTDKTLKLLEDIRPRLCPEFRHLRDDDLLVEDMFMVANKSATAVFSSVRKS